MKKVYGVGVNDAGYVVRPTIGGARLVCPYYRCWMGMLSRCYGPKSHPSYRGCTVSEEWLTFSKFKQWMEVQDWEGNELDKDLKVQGNRLYSAETCVFIPKKVNSFMLESTAARGELPLGVSFDKKLGKFYACCRTGTGRGYGYVGRFDCPEEAHKAWKKKKLELAIGLSESLPVHLRAYLINRYKEEDV